MEHPWTALMFYGNVGFKLQVDWFIKIEEGHGPNNNKGRKSWKKELLITKGQGKHMLFAAITSSFQKYDHELMKDRK